MHDTRIGPVYAENILDTESQQPFQYLHICF